MDITHFIQRRRIGTTRPVLSQFTSPVLRLCISASMAALLASCGGGGAGGTSSSGASSTATTGTGGNATG